MNGSSKCLWPAFLSSQAAGCFRVCLMIAGMDFQTYSSLRTQKNRPAGGHSLFIIQNLRFFSMQL
ncbi:hypothetical protein DXA36_17795 [Eisenbergiella sp. OF01-20]|nr:hypothetical protein DXA36_17795 [Eisenbergiella sp. OF01-20]